MLQTDGLVQERRNSSANTLELHLSCTKPSKCDSCNSITETMFQLTKAPHNSPLQMSYGVSEYFSEHCVIMEWHWTMHDEFMPLKRHLRSDDIGHLQSHVCNKNYKFDDVIVNYFTSPLDVKTVLFNVNYVNEIYADDLAPLVARPSAAMTLII